MGAGTIGLQAAGTGLQMAAQETPAGQQKAQLEYQAAQIESNTADMLERRRFAYSGLATNLSKSGVNIAGSAKQSVEKISDYTRQDISYLLDQKRLVDRNLRMQQISSLASFGASAYQSYSKYGLGATNTSTAKTG